MEKVVLSNASFEKIQVQEDCQIEVLVEKRAKASLFLSSINKSHLHLSIVLEDDSELSLLLWNESEELHLKSNIDVQQDAKMNLYFGEMSEGMFDGKVQIHLQKEGAQLEMRSAATVSTHKCYEVTCTHEAPHTRSNMENYAVVYKNGDYRMSDTGKILKGAHGSESHQTSRALILSENQKCEITPVLLIDENDVQASHATSMGQIDENQLYYLQTRGLTKTQALGLITVGYLMPIASVLEDEALEKQLSEKIEKKVGLA